LAFFWGIAFPKGKVWVFLEPKGFNFKVFQIKVGLKRELWLVKKVGHRGIGGYLTLQTLAS